jgi:hypothetical protein
MRDAAMLLVDPDLKLLCGIGRGCVTDGDVAVN